MLEFFHVRHAADTLADTLANDRIRSLQLLNGDIPVVSVPWAGLAAKRPVGGLVFRSVDGTVLGACFFVG